MQSESKPKTMEIEYYELSLAATGQRKYIDFVEPDRSILDESDEAFQGRKNQVPLRELKIFNDGTSGYIRIAINVSRGTTAYMKIPFGETLTFPIVTYLNHEVIENIVIQNYDAATTVRLIGLTI